MHLIRMFTRFSADSGTWDVSTIQTILFLFREWKALTYIKERNGGVQAFAVSVLYVIIMFMPFLPLLKDPSL